MMWKGINKIGVGIFNISNDLPTTNEEQIINT